MRLIDSHAHLQADRFDRDAEEVLAAAHSAGLERLLVPGWDVPSSEAAVSFAGRHGLDVAAGIHPHTAAEADAGAWAHIGELARQPGVVAVGETGLDYDRGFSPREAQLTNLRRHLALAVELGKPVILHCRSKPGGRDAQDELLAELLARPGVQPLIHSFSGPPDYAEQVLELGGWISFSGLVFRAGEEASAQVARLVPAARLLVETDAPYLSPPGAPRRRNEPRWVEVTARWLADRRGESAEELGARLVSNYDRLFHPDPPS